MNDFTKEELEIILLDMDGYIKRTPMLNEAPSHKSLRNKIQFMIENYCEHEYRHSNEAHFKCKNCGVPV